MTDLAVIILTKNEKLHIGRCLERLSPLEPRQVFVVDCFSTDGTQDIARECGATVVEHEWPGVHAKQLNWAIGNLPIKASWVLRLDADEYLYPDAIEEVKDLLPKWDGEKATAGTLASDVTSLSLPLSRVFCGHKIRFGGTAHIPMVRFFKYGIGRCQDRAMDEHIVTSEGRDHRLKGGFADDNRNSMDWWREKHRGYAKREAMDAVAGEKFKLSKTLYYRFPPYFRAFGYFFYRYFVRLGFLDGYAGWMWHFWQGLWYRWLVDVEIGHLRHWQLQEHATVVDLSQYRNRHGLRNIFTRIVWSMVWIVAAKWMPRFFFNRWRALLLRMFGAKIGKSCRLTGSMEVWIPSRLRMGSFVWIDRNVYLYDVDRITIGDNAIISDGAYICTASHDISKRDFPLVTAPVTIGSGAWVAAYACVMPGVTIGEGAVVAAGAVVTKDVPPWTVVGGNPAKFIKKRELAVSG